jgi:hypothetical protein
VSSSVFSVFGVQSGVPGGLGNGSGQVGHGRGFGLEGRRCARDYSQLTRFLGFFRFVGFLVGLRKSAMEDQRE